jgi:hypothetical protein
MVVLVADSPERSTVNPWQDSPTIPGLKDREGQAISAAPKKQPGYNRPHRIILACGHYLLQVAPGELQWEHSVTRDSSPAWKASLWKTPFAKGC